MEEMDEGLLYIKKRNGRVFGKWNRCDRGARIRKQKFASLRRQEALKTYLMRRGLGKIK